MPKKAILTGGKRDEIIRTAMELFFEHGYEATSVRMIMDKVGGEIGMFYHYFKSKDELFDKVADSFFQSCQNGFETLISECDSPETFADRFLPVYAESMERFGRIKDNMHWTIQYAMHARTISAMIPAVMSLLERWKTKSSVPADILAGQLIYGISATIHSQSFAGMDNTQKQRCITEYICALLK